MKPAGRITCEEWAELPIEKLVQRTILNMTVRQLELRQLNNTVHYVLNQEHRSDPLLTSNDVARLLGKTPKFIPTPKKLTAKVIEKDCDLYGYRLIKTFKRFASRHFIKKAKETSLAAGIFPWKPKQFPHSADYYENFNKDFFDVRKPLGYFWRGNSFLCPGLQRFITSFKDHAVNCAAGIAAGGVARKLNIPPRERQLIRTLVNADVGFNNSDKGYGPVLYSRNLYIEQCSKHLFDAKGTYEPICDSKENILHKVVNKLKSLLSTYCNECSATQQLAKKLTEWAEDSLKKGTLCKFYVIWKLHKPANAQGVRSRPISPNIGYPTGQISNFLHSQLADAVFSHPHVLQDSLSLIRLLENMNLSPDQEIFLTSADITALYPSINIEDGLEAMRWFMKEHTIIPENLQKLYLRLARFILENNYVECRGLAEGRFFLQKIGTAMGTSFSVTYATIFMIWLETPIIKEFQQHILLYKRFLDDVFVTWSGSIQELCHFRAKFGAANPSIKLEWQGTQLEADATDPAKFDRYKHRQVNFLDLDVRIVYSIERANFEFGVYRKPGNAFSYLPYGSYHARHVFRGWLKAEVLRLLTHSSSPKIWIEECRRFYDHLRR